MSFLAQHFLTLLVLLPLLAGVLLFTFPKNIYSGQKQFATCLAVLELLGVLVLVINFRLDVVGRQLVELVPWSRWLGLNYSLALDSAGAFITLIIAIIYLLVIILAQSRIHNINSYLALVFFSEGLLLLAVFSQNLLLFVLPLFWLNIVQFFLCGEWCIPNVQDKTLLFMASWQGAALLLLLLGIIQLGTSFGLVFELDKLLVLLQQNQLPIQAEKRIFLFFILGIIMLLPLFPLPKWLKMWHQAPLGIVALTLLQSLVLIHFLVRAVMLLCRQALVFYSPYLSVILLTVAFAAALLSLRQDYLRQVFGCLLSGFLSLGLVTLLSCTPEGISGCLLLFIAMSAAYFAICWFHRWMKVNNYNFAIVRYRGLASQVPTFCRLYVLAAASFTVVPFVAPLTGMVMGTTGIYQSRLQVEFPTYAQMVSCLYFLLVLAFIGGFIALLVWLIKTVLSNKISKITAVLLLLAALVVIITIWSELRGWYLLGRDDHAPFANFYNLLLIITVFTVFLLTAGTVRALIRLCCGTPSMTLDPAHIELDGKEKLFAVILIILLLALGVLPGIYLRFLEPLALNVAQQLGY